MITAEDTYDVADKILEIPITAIRPAPDNVRSDLGDLTELAASIREVGVLQAITVIPDASGDTFMVHMGARRHAAAELAGLMTIPAVVRSKPDNAKRVLTMLIENVQRSDISPLDEARTYARLEEEFDLDQATIAKRTGCSQPHVSKRLSLLTLPDSCKQILDAGELTIGDALEFTKLTAHPDVIADLLAQFKHITGEERHWAIEEAVEQAEHDDKIAKVENDLDNQGVTLLDAQQAARAHELVAPKEYTYRKHLELAKADIKKHAKEPCHAAHVIWEHTGPHAGKAVARPYCTSATRHAPKGDSTIKAAVDATGKVGSKKSNEQIERERREKEITRHRTAFVTELIRDQKLDRASVAAIALQHIAMGGYRPDHEKRAKLLGLDLNGRQPEIALADYVAGGTDHVLRACVAALLGTATNAFVNPDTIALLTQFGYEPQDLEREQIAEREAYLTTDDARDARDRALERAEELDDGPEGILERISELTCELDEGVSPTRAREIQAAFDQMFIELNNIQPGDIVDHDGEGHTIERASHSAAPDELEAHAAPAPPDDTHASDDVNGSIPSLPAEGAAASNLDDYQKPPKDCSNAEAWARQQIDTPLAEQPDSAELLAIRQELFAGVDEERAIEIRARLHALMQLDDYLHATSGPVERQCRDLIAKLPADNERVAELQQQLYRGVQVSTAATIRRELKDLKSKLAEAKK